MHLEIDLCRAFNSCENPRTCSKAMAQWMHNRQHTTSYNRNVSQSLCESPQNDEGTMQVYFERGNQNAAAMVASVLSTASQQNEQGISNRSELSDFWYNL